MVKTPDTDAGWLTEKVMAEVKKRLPKISTHDYNRTYEAIFHTLTAEHERRHG